jgi:predicted DNA-binding transcriptional regulator YafY
MPNSRHARHTAIVHLLRSRTWISATSLAHRFDVSQRTIYRDIEELVSYGIPIESIPGRTGGFRLSTDTPIDPLMVDGDDALKLYVLGLLSHQTSPAPADTILDPDALGVRPHARDTLRRLSQRIYFDTSDWYWTDEGSGHLTTIREALLTATAVEITTRIKRTDERTRLLLKPYGLVWKGGEWWLVAAPPQEAPQRFQLNNIDRVTVSDLKYTYPDESFDLQRWWIQALEDFGRGPNKVVITIQPAAREEMLRLGLKPDSEIHHEPDGTIRMVLYVDRWRWLVPLIASYGPDVTITEPTELRDALRQHHADALAAYDQLTSERDATVVDLRPSTTDYRNDDSRLRSTRGRTPRSIPS